MRASPTVVRKSHRHKRRWATERKATHMLSPLARMTLGVLLLSARNWALITYADLGRLIGLPTGTNEIGNVLDEVGDYTWSKHGIVLPALVVTKHDGLPGGRRSDQRTGFWDWVAQHPELQKKWPDDRALVQELQRRAFLYASSGKILSHSF